MPDHFYEAATARFLMRNRRFLLATQGKDKAIEFTAKFLAKEERLSRGSKDRITQLMKQLIANEEK
jgi:hypothetical protein